MVTFFFNGMGPVLDAILRLVLRRDAVIAIVALLVPLFLLSFFVGFFVCRRGVTEAPVEGDSMDMIVDGVDTMDGNCIVSKSTSKAHVRAGCSVKNTSFFAWVVILAGGSLDRQF